MRSNPVEYLSLAEDVDQYPMDGGFALERADNHQFIASWTVYRRVNEDFSQCLREQGADLESVPFCFWITRGDDRIGGVVMLPNNIGDFFPIPPVVETTSVLVQIMGLLQAWSDTSRPLRAQGITEEFVNSFLDQGFEVTESRHWMIRPTQVIPFTWPGGFQVRPIDSTDRDGPALHTLIRAAPKVPPLARAR
jgi:hypothetical protein